MFPGHCKSVSVRRVDFPLTEDSIRGHLTGGRVYVRTEFLVFNSGSSWAVVSVEKEKVNAILQPVLSVEVLALPEDTTFVDDPDIDVLSATRMGRLCERAGTDCVVVRGRAEHVSFFISEEPARLTLFDVVPPSPSKLVDLVDESLDSHLQDTYLEYSVVEADINDIASSYEARPVLFPCRASGLRHEDSLGYLDETPPLSPDEAGRAVLLGCSVSARIFKALYGVEPELANICPADLLREKGLVGPVLTKCCRVKQGFELRGDVAVVPWGATVSDVASAVKALVSQMSS
jgi:hypothetical protein